MIDHQSLDKPMNELVANLSKAQGAGARATGRNLGDIYIQHLLKEKGIALSHSKEDNYRMLYHAILGIQLDRETFKTANFEENLDPHLKTSLIEGFLASELTKGFTSGIETSSQQTIEKYAQIALLEDSEISGASKYVASESVQGFLEGGKEAISEFLDRLRVENDTKNSELKTEAQGVVNAIGVREAQIGGTTDFNSNQSYNQSKRNISAPPPQSNAPTGPVPPVIDKSSSLLFGISQVFVSFFNSIGAAVATYFGIALIAGTIGKITADNFLIIVLSLLLTSVFIFFSCLLFDLLPRPKMKEEFKLWMLPVENVVGIIVSLICFSIFYFVAFPVIQLLPIPGATEEMAGVGKVAGPIVFPTAIILGLIAYLSTYFSYRKDMR